MYHYDGPPHAQTTPTNTPLLQVGYSIRFENCTSEKTIIKYMTGP